VSTTEIEETARSGNRPSGPRAEAREQAILDAALELLMEVGYDRLSMDALAERAHAGKATIYRHWSGKAQVVAEAVRRLKHADLAPVVRTGSLRGDLLATMTGLCVAMTDIESAILVGVLSAMRTDPELADLVRSQINDTKIAQFEVIIAEAVRRGELPQGSSADLIGEVVPALFITRLVVLGQPVDEAFAVHVVDDVALPLLLNP
jgi:AcrR family transcriptional regulator